MYLAFICSWKNVINLPGIVVINGSDEVAITVLTAEVRSDSQIHRLGRPSPRHQHLHNFVPGHQLSEPLNLWDSCAVYLAPAPIGFLPQTSRISIGTEPFYQSLVAQDTSPDDQDIGIYYCFLRLRALRAGPISAYISFDENLSVPPLTDCRCIFFTAATARALMSFTGCLSKWR